MTRQQNDFIDLMGVILAIAILLGCVAWYSGLWPSQKNAAAPTITKGGLRVNERELIEQNP